tara:strand:- start:749 stop:2155 length:1407 start_codon:yes stop_codon:yes gene_type:complete
MENSYKAEKIIVDSLSIINYDREVISDIQRQAIDFNLYEDLFSPTMSFDATITDSNGLIERFPFVGEELIAVQFRIPSINKIIEKIFSIYKVSNRKHKGDRNEVYTLHGISLEAIVNINSTVDNSFVGMPFTKMVESVYREYFLKSNKKTAGSPFLTYDKELFIEDTIGKHSIVSPMSTPFDFIKYCAKHAQSPKYIESDYVFFENEDGFNFKTISSLLEQDSVEDYYLSDPAAKRDQNTTVKEHQIIRNFSFDDFEFDTLESIATGLYDNEVSVIDPVLKKFKSTTLNYHYTKDFTNVNKNPSAVTNRNKFTSNFSVYKDFNGSSHARYMVSNLSDGAYNQTSYIKNRSTNDPVSEYPFVRHKFLNHLISKLSQINTKFNITIVIPGDPNRKVGDVVKLYIPQKSASQEFVKRYNFLYGEYDPRFLVTAIHHNYSVQQDVYLTTLELTKDCLGQDVFTPGGAGGYDG